MKKLLLLSSLLIFACSSDDSNSSISCTDFNASTSSSDARQAAIDYDSDYDSLVSQYGQPINEGYFMSSSELGVYYYYAFMFPPDLNSNVNNGKCYLVDDQCVTYTFSAECFETDDILGCDACVGFMDQRIN